MKQLILSNLLMLSLEFARPHWFQALGPDKDKNVEFRNEVILKTLQKRL